MCLSYFLYVDSALYPLSSSLSATDNDCYVVVLAKDRAGHLENALNTSSGSSVDIQFVDSLAFRSEEENALEALGEYIFR